MCCIYLRATELNSKFGFVEDFIALHASLLGPFLGIASALVCGLLPSNVAIVALFVFL